MPISDLTQKVICGNNLDVLKKFPDNYFDSVVTDPPYGLSFMNKHWDYDVPSIELWKEVLRVLKPGGHLLSFGGTRTYHRMVVNIEDAGFEIRDQIQWLYGSGFPKSLDIGKAMDANSTSSNQKKQPENRHNVVYSNKQGKGENVWNKYKGQAVISAPSSDEAKQWDGWGTALKPANEPIVLARKPISESTIATNVLKWGTGGIYIDGCRIGDTGARNNGSKMESEIFGKYNPTEKIDYGKGRFPANVIFDEAAAAMLDEQSGELTSGAMDSISKGFNYGIYGKFKGKHFTAQASSGGASRFFYVAKPDSEERSRGLGQFTKQTVNDGREKDIDNAFQRGITQRKNIHPTVKPVDLMRYLIRLITPLDGIVLDPFNGSGTTGISAKEEFKNYVGIEIDPEYCAISEARIKACSPQIQMF